MIPRCCINPDGSIRVDSNDPGENIKFINGFAINDLTNSLFIVGAIPTTGLLVYLTRPLSDNLLIPEDEVYDESTVDIGFIATPRSGVDIADVWTAVGHTSGVASYWFDADDEPITRLAVGFGSLAGEGISELAGINSANVLFKLKDATAQTGTLAVYVSGTDQAILDKAKAVLKIT